MLSSKHMTEQSFLTNINENIRSPKESVIFMFLEEYEQEIDYNRFLYDFDLRIRLQYVLSDQKGDRHD